MKRAFGTSDTFRTSQWSALAQRVLACVCIVAGVLSTATAAAQTTYTWSGATNNTWSTTTNWNGGVVPGATSGTTNTDIALFNTNPTYRSPTWTTYINLYGFTFDTGAGAYTIGTTSGSAAFLTSGGTTQLTTGVTAAQIINAPLVILNASGSNSGSYRFLNSATASAATLTLGGAISGQATAGGTTAITFNSTQAGTISGVISNGTAGGAMSLAKTGAGTLTLSAANTYSGATSLVGRYSVWGDPNGNGTITATPWTGNYGTLQVSGSLANTSGISISGGGTFINGNSTAASNNGVSNRINSATTLTMGGTGGGGTFQMAAPAASNVHSQSFASLAIGPGYNLINTNTTTGTTNLTFTGAAGSVYTRSTGGVVNFVPGTGTYNIAFTNAPSTNVAGTGSNAILVGAFLSGTSFISAASGNLTAAAYTPNTSSSLPAGTNIDVTTLSTTGLTGLQSINSLRFSNTAKQTISLTSGTLRIASGGIITGTGAPVGASGSPSAITGGALTSGTNELVFSLQNAGNIRSQFASLQVDSQIVDNGAPVGLNISGASGMLLLTNTNNSFTGNIYLNGASLLLTNEAVLGGTNTVYATNGVNYVMASLGAGNPWSNKHSISIAPGALLDISTQNGPITVNASVTGSGVLGIGMGTYNQGSGVIIPVDQSGFTGTYQVGTFLRANDGVGLSSNANLLLSQNSTSGNGVLETSADMVRSLGAGPGQVRIGQMQGNSFGGGFSAVSGTAGANPVTVSLGGLGTPQSLTWGVGGFMPAANGGGNNNALVLQDGNANNTLTWANPINNNGYLVFVMQNASTSGTSTAATMTGAISGTGGFSKSGAGLLVLSAANTYTGTTTLLNGVLNLGSAEVAGTSGPLGASVAAKPGSIVLSGGTLQYSATNQNDYSGRFSTAASQLYNVDTNSQNVTWATALTSSTGNLTKSGAGTLTLSAANTYSGTTTVNGGVLAGGTANAFGSSAPLVVNSGTVNLGGFAQSVGALSGSSGALVTTSAAAGSATLTTSLTTTSTFAGTIVDNGSGVVAFTKSGTGTQILSGTNTYSGATTVSAGTLQFAKESALYNNTPASWTKENITVQSGASLALNVGGAGEFSTSDVTTILTNLGGLGGAVNNNGLRAGSGIVFDPTNATGASFTVADTIADSTGPGGGSISVGKIGTGTLVLSSSNSFSGGLSVSGGGDGVGVTLANSSAAGSGTITITGVGGSAGNTLRLNNGITVSNSLVMNSIASRTNVLSTGGTSTYAGNISANTSNGNYTWFNRGGAGLLVITGSVTGTTNATGSVMTIGNTSVTISGNIALAGSGTFGMFSNGVLTLSGSNTFPNFQMRDGGTLNINSAYALGTAPVLLTSVGGVAAALDNTSAGDITLAGNNNFTWGTDFSFVGTRNLNLGTGTATISGTAANTTRTITGSAGTFTVGGPIIDSGSAFGLTKAGTGTLSLAGANTYSGTTRINAGTLQLGGGGTAGSLNTASVITGSAGATLAFNRTNTITQGTDFNSVIGGAINVRQDGSGTAVFSGANTYTGTTSINAGTLRLSGAGTLGATTAALTLGGGQLDLGGLGATVGNVTGTAAFASGDTIRNGTLTGTAFSFSNTTGTATISAVLAGAANFTKSGAGVVTLSAANTYTGTTSISAGTLALAGAGTLGSSTSSVTLGGGQLDLGGLGVTVGNVTGTAAFASGDTIQNGTLTGTAFSFSNTTGTASISATLAGAANFTKSGAGVVTLSAANTYTGTTAINGGVVSASTLANGGANSSIGASSNVAGNLVLGGGSLQYTGATVTTDRSFTLTASTTSTIDVSSAAATLTFTGSTTATTGALTKAGAGTLALAGAAAYTGTTAINAGTLQIGNGSTTGGLSSSSAISISSGAALAFSRTDDYGGSFGNTVSGSGGVTLLSGSLTLSGNNTYTGQTTVSGGVLIAGRITNAFGSSAPLAVNSGTVSLTGVDQTVGALSGSAGALITSLTSGNATLTTTFASGTSTFAGSITNGSGGISFTKAGAGTQVLSGVNTYTGATTISAGVLQLGAGSPTAVPAASTLTVNGGVFDLNGNNFTTNSLAAGNAAGRITDNSAVSGTTTFTTTSLPGSTAFAITDGANGRVVAVTLQNLGNGAGSLTGASTFSGGLLVSAVSGSTRFQFSGTSSVGTAGNIVSSPFGRGTVTIGSGTAEAAQIFITSGSSVLLNDIVFNSSRGTDVAVPIRVGGSGIVLAGTLTAGLADITLGAGNGVGSATLQGRLTGTNGLWIRNSGQALTVTLSNTTGTPNDYQGTTTISTGMSLVLGAANQIPSGVGYGGMALSGTFNLGGYSSALNSLSGAGVVEAGGGTPVLSIGATDSTGTFAGTLQNATGTLSLVKSGTGTLALSAANTYTGPTSINGGTLTIASSGRLGSGNYSGALANNGAFIYSGTNAQTLAGLISGSGSITNNSASTLTLSGSVALSGAANAISNTANGTIAINGDLSTAPGSVLTLAVGGGASTGPITLSGAGNIGGEVLVTGGSGTGSAVVWLYNGAANSLSGATKITVASGNTLRYWSATMIDAATAFDLNGTGNGGRGALSLYDGGATTTINGTVNLSGNASIASRNAALTLAGNITETGGARSLTLAPDAAGAQSQIYTLGGNNSFSGGLALNASDAASFSTKFVAGSSTAFGTGPLSLNSLTQATATAIVDLNGQTITIGGLSGGNLANANSFIQSDSGAAVLTVNQATSGTFNGIIRNGAGSVALTKTGNGTLTLSSSNTFTGATTISAGILSIGGTSGLQGTSGVTIAGGAGLTYTGAAATFAKNVTVTPGSGIGTIRNSGGGTLTLSGNLSKDNSVLRLTGGSFNVTGVISGTTAGASDLYVDAASVTLSNTNTYNGPTLVYNSGTLSLGINNAIPNTSAVTLGDATTRGTLVMGTYTDAIASLTFSGSGGTVSLSGDKTASAQLATAGSLTLGSNASLLLTSPGTSAGLYRLISATSISGAFGSITGTSAGYQILTTSTSVDYQQRAVLGAVSVTNPSAAIITGGSAAFNYSVTNAALSGGASLSVTGTGLSNVVGSSSGSALGGGSTGALSGLAFTGTSIGNDQQGTFTVNAPDAYGLLSTTGTVSVNVLDHALPGFVGTGSNGITDPYAQTVLNLDFGSVDETAGVQSLTYSLTNLVSLAYGANLTAGLDLTSYTTDGDGFASGLSLFNNLLAGGTSSLFSLTFTPSGQGTFSKTFTLSFSDNRNLSGAATRRDLTINAQVIVVPEPGAIALAVVGVAMAGWSLWRRRRTAP